MSTTTTINVNGTSVTATETTNANNTTLEQTASSPLYFTEIDPVTYPASILNYDQVGSLISQTGFSVPTGIISLPVYT